MSKVITVLLLLLYSVNEHKAASHHNKPDEWRSAFICQQGASNKDSLIIHEQFQGTSSAQTHE